MMVPFAHFKSRDTAVRRSIEVTFSGTPTFFNIAKSIVRFDKTFAFSWSMDDSLGDATYIAIPAFQGGNVTERDGVHINQPGMFYTDGCGNDLPFNFELKLVGSWINNDAASGYYLNYQDFRKAYALGCSYVNHSYEHKDADSKFSSDPAVKMQQLIDEVINNYEAIRINTGIRMNNFTPPSNYPPYFPVAYQLYLENKIKRINYMRPDLSTTERTNYESTLYPLEFYATLTDIGSGGVRDFNTWKHSTITGTVADVASINTKIAATTPTQHYWFTAASHALGLGFGAADADPGTSFKWSSFKSFFERLHSTYGKTGADNMWMDNDTNVWEYLQCWKYATISVLDKTSVKKEISVNFANCRADFRYHRLSFVISTDAAVTGVNISGYDKASFKINHKGLGNGNVLVNIEYMPTYESALFRRLNSLVVVERAELTRKQTDKDLAQGAVNLLLVGNYRTTLQNRINSIVIIPDSITVKIDLGLSTTSYPTATPWNNLQYPASTVIPVGYGLSNLLSISSEVTPWGISVTSQFSNAASSAATDDGNLLYPWSAHRDAFQTAAGTYGVLTITGLNSAKLYDVKLYSSRSFIQSVQKWTVNGVVKTQNIYDNRRVTTDFLNTVPVNGTIVIRVEGNTGSTVGNLSIIEMTEHS